MAAQARMVEVKEMRSGQIPDIAIDSEGLVVGFQRKEHRMTLRLLTFR